MTTMTPAAEITLLPADRCDRCTAQAYVLVQLPNVKRENGQTAALPLIFCAHHFADAEPKLLILGATVLLDNRPQLIERETKVHA